MATTTVLADIKIAPSAGERTKPVHGEFVLMQLLVFGINRDSVCANDSI